MTKFLVLSTSNKTAERKKSQSSKWQTNSVPRKHFSCARLNSDKFRELSHRAQSSSKKTKKKKKKEPTVCQSRDFDTRSNGSSYVYFLFFFSFLFSFFFFLSSTKLHISSNHRQLIYKPNCFSKQREGTCWFSTKRGHSFNSNGRFNGGVAINRLRRVNETRARPRGRIFLYARAN